MILRNLLWVGLGSFAGGALRYLIAQLTCTHGFDGSFPGGTFIVNLTGSFLLGLLFGLSARYSIFPDEIRLLLMVGFCGGFTTFSSFIQENALLLQTGQYATIALYTLTSLIGGTVLFFLAVSLVKSFS